MQLRHNFVSDGDIESGGWWESDLTDVLCRWRWDALTRVLTVSNHIQAERTIDDNLVGAMLLRKLPLLALSVALEHDI